MCALPENYQSGQGIIAYITNEIGADNDGYLESVETLATCKQLVLLPGLQPRFNLNLLDGYRITLTTQDNSLYEHCETSEWYFLRNMDMLKDNPDWKTFCETQRKILKGKPTCRQMRQFVIV